MVTANGIEFIKYAISIGALEFIREGRKLKSGRISHHFFDAGKFRTGKQTAALANFYSKSMHGLPDHDVVFGKSYKGIHLAVAVSMTYYNVGWDVSWAYDRKEAKDHGEGGIIVGDSMEGKRVCLIDDVITGGGSMRDANSIVKKAKGIPVCAAIAFDRQEKGGGSNFSAVQEFVREYQIPITSIARLEDLISVLRFDSTNNYDSWILPKIMEYKEKYGI